MPTDDHVYREPSRATALEALADASKSPPAVAHACVGNTRCDHVASPPVAATPVPSSIGAWLVPSPQLALTRCSVNA
jgi:hypothetical protein